MSVTHTIQISYIGGSNNPPAMNLGFSAGMENNISEAVPAGTDTLIAYTLDVSQAKAIYIHCNVDALLETNSSSGGPVALSLKAGNAIVWNSQTGQTNPFSSTDVTALYLTNVADAILNIRCAVDPTV